MRRFVVQRLISLVLTLFVASVVIFGALYLAPGDPATLLAGGHVTPQIIAEIHQQYHLNDPVCGALLGLADRRPARQPRPVVRLSRAGHHAALAAHRQHALPRRVRLDPHHSWPASAWASSPALTRRISSAITVVTGIGLATPSFVAAIVLITVFAVDLGWFPVFGAGVGIHGPALAPHAAGGRARDLLGRLRRAAHAHVDPRGARARARRDGAQPGHPREPRGAPPRAAQRAGSRSRPWPASPSAGLIAGDVVVEQAFGINGLGSFLVQATSQKDVAVVQSISLLLVAVFVVVNAIVDLLNGALDPRLRVTRGG